MDDVFAAVSSMTVFGVIIPLSREERIAWAVIRRLRDLGVLRPPPQSDDPPRPRRSEQQPPRPPSG